jgi:hypothetical protein
MTLEARGTIFGIGAPATVTVSLSLMIPIRTSVAVFAVGVWRRLSHAQRDLMLACLDAPAKFMSRIGAEKTLTCA